MTKRTGGCLCGRVRYRIWSASAPARACLDQRLERIGQQPAPPQPSRGAA